MDKWNVHHHTKSGLIDRVRQSTVSMLEAEQKTLEFIATYVYKGHSPLCGNSIGHDRRFLYKYMPNLVSHLHYRNIDISTLKELAKRWDPVLAKSFNKESKHIAMDDIMDSIEELRFYRQHFLKESIDVPRS
jgi:oligoribonuclease